MLQSESTQNFSVKCGELTPVESAPIKSVTVNGKEWKEYNKDRVLWLWRMNRCSQSIEPTS
jgi:hypothetical protein